MYKPQEAAQQKLKAEKTAFTQKVLEEQKQVREEMIKREEEKKEQLLRRIKYGKLVKDLYKPKINSALRLSREELDDKSKRNTSQSHKGFKKIFNQQNKNTTQCSSPDKNFVDDNQQVISWALPTTSCSLRCTDQPSALQASVLSAS